MYTETHAKIVRLVISNLRQKILFHIDMHIPGHSSDPIFQFEEFMHCLLIGLKIHANLKQKYYKTNPSHF